MLSFVRITTFFLKFHRNHMQIFSTRTESQWFVIPSSLLDYDHCLWTVFCQLPEITYDVCKKKVICAMPGEANSSELPKKEG